MNWATRIIQEKELSAHRSHSEPNDLPFRIKALMRHQERNWPLLRDGVQSLSRLVTKTIPLGSFEVFAQFNPNRLRSTTAKVDEKSIQHRPCFLCPPNLPPEEKGLTYGDEFIILCNPFPILTNHLSIVHRSHIEQAIAGYFETVLDLAKDLAPEYFVLYNGPQCGASAPDHLHFQASSRQRLPIEKHLAAVETNPELKPHKRVIVNTGNILLFTLADYHLRVLIYRGSDRAALIEWFYRTLDILMEHRGKGSEPLVNLIVTFNNQDWNVFLFPRSKHRPSCYFAAGDEKLMVSPAAIDLAGCLVIPVEEHFHKTNPEMTRHIFSEVTLADGPFLTLIERLRQQIGR